ncbi:hypothetical protein [Candidatus Venteria ishoeyi]|uniref:Uncharacterized protein n=1 Tax=Candidatus Venteria ishoeyi TaxID=1899563 RepID=A0A1H6FAX1_9GAMM|nr:hypothetical protein [Candidatus Venteria ishoeyi]SEH06155.1 Uncharacterised protein [Candidatus Venteria ishoeyi]
MSYLDQLKKKADEVKAQAAAEGKDKAQLDAKMTQEVIPKMQVMYQYFHEMVQQLNYIKPDTKISYEVQGLGNYDELMQDEFILGNYDKTRHHFFLRILCHKQRKVRFQIQSEEAATAQQEYLWKHNVQFKWAQINDKKERFLKAIFELQGRIVIELEFDAQYDDATIHLKAKNIHQLGRKDYIFQARDLSSEFLDKLAMYITYVADDNVLAPFETDTIWGHLDKNPEQRIRQKIIKEMAQKNTPAMAQTQKSNTTSPPVQEKSVKTSTKKTEKKGLFRHLFGQNK